MTRRTSPEFDKADWESDSRFSWPAGWSGLEFELFKCHAVSKNVGQTASALFFPLLDWETDDNAMDLEVHMIFQIRLSAETETG